MIAKSRTIGAGLALATGLFFIGTATQATLFSASTSHSVDPDVVAAIDRQATSSPICQRTVVFAQEPLARRYMLALYERPVVVAQQKTEQRQALAKAAQEAQHQKELAEKQAKKELALAKKTAKTKKPTVQYAIAVNETTSQVSAESTTSSDDVARVMTVSATAYSSTVDQTDGSPCTTANGYNVCKNNQENVIAANFLPFGTRIRIPDMFGDRVFVVQDRMASRYQSRIDVWMKTREAALQFGVRKVKIEVLEN